MSQFGSKKSAILPLYIPVILSYLLIYTPILSYFIAWAGSFYIFYHTWYSPSAYFKQDLPFSKQLMRPLFLIQLIFAGFMACTSIFFFLDHLGYRYLSKLNLGDSFLQKEKTFFIAECQRLSLLAHAALVTGIVMFINKEIKPPKYIFIESKNQLIKIALIIYILGLIAQQISGLSQVALPLTNIGISCAAVLFLRGILNKNIVHISIGASIFFSNFISASLSGYKEPIIVNIIILAIIFYPYYKRIILFLSVPVMYIIFYFLPSYNAIVRTSWSGEISAETAQAQAFETLIGNENEEEIAETNWSFLTNRFSEMSMFTEFVQYVPEKRDFYGWEIFNQSVLVLVPRVFWPEKPNIEEISMERVYEAGVANRLSSVSAKTRPVVDAYLSWGTFGVFFFLLAYGILVQAVCNRAEKMFGGYELGCIIIFNSLFQNLWRGNNFEFMFNNIFYAYLIMWFLWWIFKILLILVPNPNYR
ncbi:exosortase Y-associated Wzy-like protein [Pedobacter flavus]|uniref:Oligosaccharide repeat unit polymerase n=1 Tax=Pedobacter flavus TaxID=3113906 RepID=A0ABU7GY15_9SPHI|nr:hypothetical protein [Pedobacter sp. VNH31]MEE1883929.1 hypothetical protein [Pedobacter sp. VNH31]